MHAPTRKPEAFITRGKDKIDRRNDSRKLNEFRKAFMQTDVIDHASGSAYIELNSTKVICGVYGPRESLKRTSYSENGVLKCDFKFAPFASQSTWNDIRQSDEEREMSHMIEQSLTGAVILERYPKSVIDIYIMVLEDDGGAIGAAMSAASLALANASIEMRDLVGCCTVGKVEDKLIVDPSGSEERFGQGRMLVGYMPAMTEIVQVIQSGDMRSGESEEALELCLDGCKNVYMLQQQCLLRMAERKLEAAGVST